MTEIIHNKLVRDNIPKILQDKGLKTHTRVLTEAEYTHFLKQKLLEEVHEYLAAQEESHQIEELADILEVIYTLLSSLKKSPQELETFRQKKQKTRGGFQDRVFLEKTINNRSLE